MSSQCHEKYCVYCYKLLGSVLCECSLSFVLWGKNKNYLRSHTGAKLCSCMRCVSQTPLFEFSHNLITTNSTGPVSLITANTTDNLTPGFL